MTMTGRQEIKERLGKNKLIREKKIIPSYTKSKGNERLVKPKNYESSSDNYCKRLL